MPNLAQTAFLLSAVITFAVLWLVSSWLNGLLLARGYDIRELILIGLPKDAPPRPLRFTHPYPNANADMSSVNIPVVGDVNTAAAAEYVQGLHAVDIPGVGTVDLLALCSSPAFAMTMTVATAAFIYLLKSKGGKKTLDPTKWQEFPLAKITKVSPNTAIYTFALANQNDILGLPIGQHISVSAEINGKDIVRSYTPISSDDDRGHFDLLVKAYEKGNISRYFSLLKVGDKVRIKGPKGAFNYTSGLSSHLGMIAGGTGITPMLQVVRAALKDASDKTRLTLIYANVNYEDILLKKEIDSLVEAHPDQFSVYYVLNNPPEGWLGGVGFVTKDMIEKHMPPGSMKDSKVLMCGPPPMLTAMKAHLAELNYPAPRTISKLADQVFCF